MKLLSFLLLCMTLLPAEAAFAESRYALIVGNNRGTSKEVKLQYAESDAEKIAKTLNQVADFKTQNILTLKGKNHTEIRQALASLNARVRQENDPKSVLMVYYSGHADEESLHMNGGEFSLQELKDLVKGSAAQFRFLVVDACRSGALTRTKGGKFTSPLALDVSANKEHEGLVVMTASAAGEDAQESDELRASFFSHYFSSALRGLADQNGDGAINLEELYKYTYEQTVKQSSATLVGTQHPTFQYAYRGVGEFVLARALDSKDIATLEFPEGINFLVFEDDAEGSVILEIGAHHNHRKVRLSFGNYFIRGRDFNTLYEGKINLEEGEQRKIDILSFERVDYARLVRKGESEALFSSSLSVKYQAFSPVAKYQAFCHGPGIQYAVHFQYLSTWLRSDFCYRNWQNDYLKADELQSALQIGLSYLWDFDFVSLSVGGGLGSSVYYQTFESRGIAPDILSPALLLSLRSSVLIDLPGPFYTELEVEGRSHILRRREAEDIFIDTPFFVGGNWGLGIEF